MITKRPNIIDVSGYNTCDFSKGTLYFNGIIIKSSEGVSITDPKFQSNFIQAKQLVNIPVGIYHFYRKAFTFQEKAHKLWTMVTHPIRSLIGSSTAIWPASNQAQHWVDVINANGGLRQGDQLFLDCEEDGMSLSGILDCAYQVEMLTGVKPVIYSRVLLLNALSTNGLTSDQLNYLATLKFWIAWYPYYPDNYNWIPTLLNGQYAPNSIVGWQYTESGPAIPGISGAIDYSTFQNDYFQAWKDAYYQNPTPTPVPDPSPVSMSLFDGAATITDITEYLQRPSEWRIVTSHLIAIDLTKGWEIFIDPVIKMQTVPVFLKNNNLQLAFNGPDGWYTVGKGKKARTSLVGYNEFNGLRIVGSGNMSNEQFVKIAPGWVFSFLPVTSRTLKAVTSFPNKLIENGVLSPLNKPIEYRARTAYGVSKDQKTLYVYIVDGGDVGQNNGMSHYEVQSRMLQWCDMSWMGDGGGSTTGAYQDPTDGLPRIIGTPSGEEKYTVRGQTFSVRPVAIRFGLRKL